MGATDRVLRAGVVLAIIGVAAQTCLHVVNLFVFDDRYSQLDLSAEHTVAAWASTMATAGAACAALLLAARPDTSRPRLFALLGALLAYLSLDDSVEVHERLGTWTAEALGLPESVGPRIWLLVYLPVLATTALLLFWSARAAGGRPGRFQHIGIGLLVAAAFSEGVGVLTKLLEQQGLRSPHRLRAALEEGLELGGWVIVAAGLAAAFYAEPVSGRLPSRRR